MRHGNSNRKFGRKTDERRALLSSLAEALFVRGKIKTTTPKAKELKSYAEKLITKARVGTLAARRSVISKLGNEKRAKKLFDVVAPKYKDRTGGYTRIVKLPNRTSDGSPMAIIELV